MRYTNAKISFGYRADEFFSAKDGGFANERSLSLRILRPICQFQHRVGGINRNEIEWIDNDYALEWIVS